MDEGVEPPVGLLSAYCRPIPAMDAAVERAVGLCLEARSQRTADKAAEEMVAYVKNCQESE